MVFITPEASHYSPPPGRAFRSSERPTVRYEMSVCAATQSSYLRDLPTMPSDRPTTTAVLSRFHFPYLVCLTDRLLCIARREDFGRLPQKCWSSPVGFFSRCASDWLFLYDVHLLFSHVRINEERPTWRLNHQVTPCSLEADCPSSSIPRPPPPRCVFSSLSKSFLCCLKKSKSSSY